MGCACIEDGCSLCARKPALPPVKLASSCSQVQSKGGGNPAQSAAHGRGGGACEQKSLFSFASDSKMFHGNTGVPGISVCAVGKGKEGHIHPQKILFSRKRNRNHGESLSSTFAPIGERYVCLLSPPPTPLAPLQHNVSGSSSYQ